MAAVVGQQGPAQHLETILLDVYIVSVLGRDKGYTVKYNPLPEGVDEGEA